MVEKENISPQSLSLWLSGVFRARYNQYVNFAHSYVKDRAIAEDMVMDAFSAIWESNTDTGKWSSKSDLEAYVLTIVRNRAINHLRHITVRNKAGENIKTLEERDLNQRIATLEACDPKAIFCKDIEEIVQKAVEQIPLPARKIFYMSRYEHLSAQEIAEKLNISVKTVHYHIARALDFLRTKLSDYIITLFF